jgi:hypothetical protein
MIKPGVELLEAIIAHWNPPRCNDEFPPTPTNDKEQRHLPDCCSDYCDRHDNNDVWSRRADKEDCTGD